MSIDRDLRRQILTVVTYVLTVVANGAAVALPLNDLRTDEISDRFPALVIPADFVFSIWSVIYVALLAFTAAKMLASEWVHVSAGLSVTIIGAVLLATIAASVWQTSTPVRAQ